MASQLIALTTLAGQGLLVNALDIVVVAAATTGSVVHMGDGSSLRCSADQAEVLTALQNVETVVGTFSLVTSAGNPDVSIVLNLDKVAGTETIVGAAGNYERVTMVGGLGVDVASTHSAFVTLITDNETADGGSAVVGYTQVESDAKYRTIASSAAVVASGVLNNLTLTAGNGLSGGGTLASNRSFAVVAGSGLIVGATGLHVQVASGLFLGADVVGIDLSLVARDGSQYIVLSGNVLSGVTIV